MNTHLVPNRSPWLTSRNLPCIPSPSTRFALTSLSAAPPARQTPVLYFFSVHRSGFTLNEKARRITGRIVFVILRTACSPPVAPHPASRRRSYLRLPGLGIIPEEDFRLPDRACSQAHSFPSSSLGTHLPWKLQLPVIFTPP